MRWCIGHHRICYYMGLHCSYLTKRFGYFEMIPLIFLKVIGCAKIMLTVRKVHSHDVWDHALCFGSKLFCSMSDLLFEKHRERVGKSIFVLLDSLVPAMLFGFASDHSAFIAQAIVIICISWQATLFPFVLPFRWQHQQ